MYLYIHLFTFNYHIWAMCLAARWQATSLRAQVYKDSNHKPEMALALSDFTALCGFVEIPQLTAALESTPELRGLVGDAMSSLVSSSANTELRHVLIHNQPL